MANDLRSVTARTGRCDGMKKRRVVAVPTKQTNGDERRRQGTPVAVTAAVEGTIVAAVTVETLNDVQSCPFLVGLKFRVCVLFS